jgi:hypothetical protein
MAAVSRQSWTRGGRTVGALPTSTGAAGWITNAGRAGAGADAAGGAVSGASADAVIAAGTPADELADGPVADEIVAAGGLAARASGPRALPGPAGTAGGADDSSPQPNERAASVRARAVLASDRLRRPASQPPKRRTARPATTTPIATIAPIATSSRTSNSDGIVRFDRSTRSAAGDLG